MSNSSLVNYTRISPNSTNPRKDTIKKITIHHVAGNASVETLGNIFAPESRNASANYGISSDGRVGMYVEEKNRAWTSGNADNDNQAITIEVANDGGAPDWHVSDKALAKLIDLCVDICKRNNIKKLNFTGDANGNLTMHRYFQATACPGNYLASKFPYIADEVNKRICTKEYTVVAGDSYWAIAEKHGDTSRFEEIQKLNDNKPLYAGHKILIPSDMFLIANTTPKYVGYLDSVTKNQITGWAWNSINDAVLRVDFHVYKDNKLVKTFSTNANLYREDLKKAGKGNGKHGFVCTFDFASLGSGTYTVKAYTNGVQLNNTKTITVNVAKPTVTPKPSTTVTSSNTTVSTGQKLTLNKVKLYSSSNAGKESGTITGAYYIWSKEIINGRVRITNSPSRIGVSGQVTGFINVSDIGVKTTTNTTTVVNNAPKEGERIKLKSGATYFDGDSIPTWLKILPLYHRGVNKYHKDCIDFSWKKTGAISGTIKADMVTKA